MGLVIIGVSLAIGLIYARRLRQRHAAAAYNRAPRGSSSSVGTTTTGFGTLQTPAQRLDPWANLLMVNDGDANAFATATTSRNQPGPAQQQMEVI